MLPGFFLSKVADVIELDLFKFGFAKSAGATQIQPQQRLMKDKARPLRFWKAVSSLVFES